MSRAFSGIFWAILVIESRNLRVGKLVAWSNFDGKVDNRPENRKNAKIDMFERRKNSILTEIRIA